MWLQRYLIVNNVNNIDRIHAGRGIVFPVFLCGFNNKKHDLYHSIGVIHPVPGKKRRSRRKLMTLAQRKPTAFGKTTERNTRMSTPSLSRRGGELLNGWTGGVL